jgi:hypothetical protein
MLAYDYPLMGVFWSMIVFFLFFAWLMLLFRVFGDIFRNHDMGGWGKALWSIFVVLVPFLGVFIYLIAHGHDMTQRDIDRAQQNDTEFRAYVQDAAGSSGSADELAKLAGLRDSGVITEQEFAAQKAKVLA